MDTSVGKNSISGTRKWSQNLRLSSFHYAGWAILSLFSALTLGISGCSSTPEYGEIITGGDQFDELFVPGVDIIGLNNKPLKNNTKVQPGTPITINSSNGRIKSVTLRQITPAGMPPGEIIAGMLNADGTSWVKTGELSYGAQYSLTANIGGLTRQSVIRSNFTTTSATQLTQAYLVPDNNATVGIGQPVVVKFDESIPNRRVAQNAIVVQTNPPVEGAFYWLSDTEVHWRPQEYWKPGTTVKVAVNTFGIDLGNGLYGESNQQLNFKIGRSVIATADDKTKIITIRRDGKVIKTMPTSMGKDSTPTSKGVYIIGDRRPEMIMDSSTYGVPVNSAAGYRTPVEFATQMSYSGIYVHAAPWSEYAQGNTNTSHGCLNVNTTNAKWFQDNVLRGDIVQVFNTIGDPLPGTDGLGDWNMPWEKWKIGNAGP